MGLLSQGRHMSANGETEAKPNHTGLRTEAQPKGKLWVSRYTGTRVSWTPGYRTQPLSCLVGGRGLSQYVSNGVGVGGACSRHERWQIIGPQNWHLKRPGTGSTDLIKVTYQIYKQPGTKIQVSSIHHSRNYPTLSSPEAMPGTGCGFQGHHGTLAKSSHEDNSGRRG